MKKISTNILTPLSAEKILFKQNVTISFDKHILKISEGIDPNAWDYTDCVCTPGFIDTHVHLSQHNIKGKHSSNLLDWLNTYVFQEE